MSDLKSLLSTSDAASSSTGLTFQSASGGPPHPCLLAATDGEERDVRDRCLTVEASAVAPLPCPQACLRFFRFPPPPDNNKECSTTTSRPSTKGTANKIQFPPPTQRQSTIAVLSSAALGKDAESCLGAVTIPPGEGDTVDGTSDGGKAMVLSPWM